MHAAIVTTGIPFALAYGSCTPSTTISLAVKTWLKIVKSTSHHMKMKQEKNMRPQTRRHTIATQSKIIKAGVCEIFSFTFCSKSGTLTPCISTGKSGMNKMKQKKRTRKQKKSKLNLKIRAISPGGRTNRTLKMLPLVIKSGEIVLRRQRLCLIMGNQSWDSHR